MAASEPTHASPVDQYSTQEKLLLSQAVYKVGAVAWPVVSKLLLEHPLCIPRPAKLFSPESCESAYVSLMTSTGQNVPAADSMKPQAKSHLRLAQTFYLARLNELKEEIARYEVGFTTLMGEIQSLKNGELDDTIREELRAGLARKYGKKLLENWAPTKEEVIQAVEAGPVKEGEVEAQADGARNQDVEPVEGVEKGKKASKKDKPRSKASVEPISAVPSAKEEVQDVITVDEKAEGPEQETEAEQVESPQPAEGIERPQESRKAKGKKPASTDAPPRSSRKSAPAKEPSPEVMEVEDSDENEAEKENDGESKDDSEKESSPSTPKPSPPNSELTPPPSVRPDRSKAHSPAGEPDSTSIRASKRKASAQPKGAPASKRSGRGRREASVATPSEAVSDAEDEEVKEIKAEDEEHEEEATGRGRRQSRRQKPQDSPAASARTKGSSPARSRRAPSVSSTTSHPADEKRSARRSARKGMRDEVVSKNAREQSAVEEDEDEAAEEEEAEPRSTRSRKGKPEPAAEEKKGRPKRGSLRTSTPQTQGRDGDDEDVQDAHDASAPHSAAAAATVPSKGGRASLGRSDSAKDAKGMKNMMLGLLETIQAHKYGSIFALPVRKSDAEDYYDVIKKPMDLKKIRSRIREGQIANIDEFERDILLLFANAMMYNAEGSQVYDMAMEMLKDSENHIAHYRSMQHDMGR